jgi:hypothetical protein
MNIDSVTATPTKPLGAGRPNVFRSRSQADGGVFMPIEIDDGDLSRLAADKAHEHGRVTTQLFVALGDGNISPDEARDLLKQVDVEMRALMTLRAKLVSLAKKD